MNDGCSLTGHGVWVLRGPDGQVKESGEFTNLITDAGDGFYAGRSAGTSAATVTGMRFGTGVALTAKNGIGAALGGYVAGSQHALDAAPTVINLGAGAGQRIRYIATWAAGVATTSQISEVVITTESPLTDAAGTAGNTVSRARLSPTVNKGSLDSFQVTWDHDFLGAGT